MCQSPFSNIRALDLSGENGLFCGKIFADLGMDVIKVEKPGGDLVRNRGPFYKDNPHPERNLFWFAFNSGKRSITLNIQTTEGKRLFVKLVKRIDFLIESFKPGYMESLDLDYPKLREINPNLIYISISGFGQEGPYRNFKAPDIVVMALSGVMNLVGSLNRPPLRIGIPQAYLHAGAEAAAGGLIALWHREGSHKGQYIDVSAQESVTWECFQAQSFWNLNRLNIHRAGSKRLFGTSQVRYVYPCKDGYVFYLLLGGAVGASSLRALVECMDKEGAADDFLRSFDWDSFEPGTFTTEDAQKVEPYFARFFLTKTKQELIEKSLEFGLLVGPVYTIKDLVNNPQLRSRRFWVGIEHEELGTKLLYPGFPYFSKETPCKVMGRAPFIGEHNAEIFIDEVNLASEDLRVLKEAGVI